jgi:hypothetical protein
MSIGAGDHIDKVVAVAHLCYRYSRDKGIDCLRQQLGIDAEQAASS